MSLIVFHCKRYSSSKNSPKMLNVITFCLFLFIIHAYVLYITLFDQKTLELNFLTIGNG